MLHDDCGAVTNFIDEKFIAEKIAEFQAKCSWHKGKKLPKKLEAELAAFIAEITRAHNASVKSTIAAFQARIKKLEEDVKAAQLAKLRDGSVGQAQRAIDAVKKEIGATNKPLADRIDALETALSDKGKRLSNHFHRSAAQADAQTLPLLDKVAFFKRKLFNCLKHWAAEEDHSECDATAPCRQPGWLRDTVPLNADAVEVLQVQSHYILYK